MGLAASQARLLTITARKMNCENESTSIAQQKLSITRELATATEDYSNALNQTTLVWDTSGLDSTYSDTAYEFSYDLMMTPSELNGYDPYLLTNRTGQVVLNDKMTSAAEAAGIAFDGSTTPSDEGYQKFITELGVQGYLTPSQVTTINGDTATYYNSTAGIGGEPIDKTVADIMTIGTMIISIQDKAEEYEEYSDMRADGEVLTSDEEVYADYYDAVDIDLSTLSSGTLYDGTTKVTDDSLLVTEFLAEDITYTSSNLSNAKTEVSEIMAQIYEAFESILSNDSMSSIAYAYAQMQMDDIINDSVAYNDSGSSTYSLTENADNYFAWVSSVSSNYAISITNLTSSFLTYYAQAMSNFTSNYNVSTESNNSYYVTADPEYYYGLENETAITENDLLVSDFYSNLYNNICAKGYTTNESIDDNDYLENSVKNGSLFVTTMYEDYCYYQTGYSQVSCLVEIEDTEAITRAETEYAIVQANLNYKEELLDLDFQELDAEISALSTELESVKSLISSSVEKTFTMFSGS